MIGWEGHVITVSHMNNDWLGGSCDHTCTKIGWEGHVITHE